MTGMQQQRQRRAIIAIGCAVALLLPVVSIFDDDFFDRDTFDTLAAVLVATLVVSAGLTALTLVEPQRRSLVRYPRTTPCDPRSPPRA